MTGSMSSEDDIIAAAELSLGLLPPNERSVMTMRLARDPTFAAAKAAWDDHLVRMTDGRQEPPPAHVWDGIDALVRTEAIDRRAAKRPWQIATGFATAAALALTVVAFERPERPSQPAPAPVVHHLPSLVATLSGDAGPASVTIGIDRTGGAMLIAANRLSLGTHSAELWAVPSSAKPVSLGLLPIRAPSWRALTQTAVTMLQPGATLAVSLEPVGGSPTGQPTGPIILKGVITGD